MSVEFGKYYINTGVFEGEEEDLPSSLSQRGQNLTSLLNCLSYGLLRCGFLIHLSVIIVGYVSYSTIYGPGLFSFDLFSTPETLRNNLSYIKVMMVLQSLFLAGSISLAAFQIFLADDAKYACI